MAATIASRGRSRRRVSSEINITPLVDVMLVLLVIFMVTSPMMLSGVDVELPKSNSTAISGSDEPLVVTIDKRGTLYLQETALSEQDMAKKLAYVHAAKPDSRVLVKGDVGVPYGKVIGLFSIVKRAGFNEVALVTELSNG